MVKIGKKWTKVKSHQNSKARKTHASRLKKRGLEVKTKGKTIYARDPK